MRADVSAVGMVMRDQAMACFKEGVASDEAVEAAVDVIRLLAEDQNTQRMRVGGFRISDRNQALMTLEGGRLYEGFARIPAGEVGFDDGCDWLNQPGQAVVTQAAGRSVGLLCDPRLKLPVSARWLDALSWYGQGVRDASNGAASVKFVTAVERLVITGSEDDGELSLTSLGSRPRPDRW